MMLPAATIGSGPQDIAPEPQVADKANTSQKKVQKVYRKRVKKRRRVKKKGSRWMQMLPPGWKEILRKNKAREAARVERSLALNTSLKAYGYEPVGKNRALLDACIFLNERIEKKDVTRRSIKKLEDRFRRRILSHPDFPAFVLTRLNGFRKKIRFSKVPKHLKTMRAFLFSHLVPLSPKGNTD